MNLNHIQRFHFCFSTEIDDEDELLYGESAPNLFDKAASQAQDVQNEGNKSWKRFLKPIKTTFWTFSLRENGTCEIMSLPDFTVKYLIHNLSLAPDILTDALFTAAKSTEMENIPKVNEILMVALGEQKRRPLLLAKTTDQELLMYEVYPFYDSKLDAKQLKMRFKKVKHGLILRERRSK